MTELETLIAQRDALNAQIAAMQAAAPPAAPRPPLMVSNVVPPAWSAEIAMQCQQNYLDVFNAGPPYPAVPPLSAQQALVSYANRPETSEADYVAVRDGMLRISKMIGTTERYGVGCPRVLHENANLPGDPNMPGFGPD